MMDYSRVKDILKKNSEKNFVKRVLNPEKYPKLNNGDGTESTHSMAADVDSNGNWFVYPTVLMTSEGLKRFPREEAFRNAAKTNNVIKFDSPEEALAFSIDYKQVWK